MIDVVSNFKSKWQAKYPSGADGYKNTLCIMNIIVLTEKIKKFWETRSNVKQYQILSRLQRDMMAIMDLLIKRTEEWYITIIVASMGKYIREETKNFDPQQILEHSEMDLDLMDKVEKLKINIKFFNKMMEIAKSSSFIKELNE